MKKTLVNLFLVSITCLGMTLSVATYAEDDLEEDADELSEMTSAAPLKKHENPEIVVREATDRLIELLRAKESTVAQDFYRTVVEDTVGPFVDFRSISRRVMAKHYKGASAEQRQRFASSFKESLLNTYANGLSAFNDQKIIVLPFKGIEKKGTKERAKVEMEIRTGDGTVYPITYAMYKNKVGDWKLENLVLNGINLGLTFRNQFNESYRSHGGDIDKVIDTWNVKLTTAAADAKP